MDYHIFILSRIRERWLAGAEPREAVVDGIAVSAGVVSSAALIMAGVFTVFMTLSAIEYKMLGLGMALAILIDATVVRGVLLPAAMSLLGERAGGCRISFDDSRACSRPPDPGLVTVTELAAPMASRTDRSCRALRRGPRRARRGRGGRRRSASCGVTTESRIGSHARAPPPGAAVGLGRAWLVRSCRWRGSRRLCRTR
jgi:hypothetical protein